MNELGKYRFTCTLSLGDIFGQIVVWVGVIFASLASALALMSHPIYSFAAVGLIIVTSLPFLLFAFVTTLFNHIEIIPVTEADEKRKSRSRSTTQIKNVAKAAS
jgi:hypothetical protein